MAIETDNRRRRGGNGDAVSTPSAVAPDREARLAAWWHAWRPAVLFGVLAGLAFRVISAVVGLQTAWDGTWPERLRHPGEALKPFAQWDSNWYLAIAQHGYAANQNIPDGSGHLQSALVFPPVFPGLIRAASEVVGAPHVAALLVVWVGLTLALIGLYRLVELQWGDRHLAGWSVLLLLAFPPAMFFGVVYADAIVLAGVVWAFLFARQRRWLLAGVCLAIAGMTKTVAFVAAVGVLVEWWTVRRNSSRPLLDVGGIVAPPVVALLAWMGYQAAAFGDPLKFLAAESQWGRHLSPPWTAIAEGFHDVTAQHWLQAGTPYFLDLLAIPLLIGTMVYGWRRMPRSWVVYCGVLLVALTLSGKLLSVDRYVLIAFPMFVAGALALRGREWLRTLAVVSLVLIDVDLMHRFITTGWAG
jgi:hypothetical protein